MAKKTLILAGALVALAGCGSGASRADRLHRVDQEFARCVSGHETNIAIYNRCVAKSNAAEQEIK